MINELRIDDDLAAVDPSVLMASRWIPALMNRMIISSAFAIISLALDLNAGKVEARVWSGEFLSRSKVSIEAPQWRRSLTVSKQGNL